MSQIPARAILEALAIRQALEGVTVKRAVACEAMGGLDAALVPRRAMAARNNLRGFHEANETFHEAPAWKAAMPVFDSSASP